MKCEKLERNLETILIVNNYFGGKEDFYLLAVSYTG